MKRLATSLICLLVCTQTALAAESSSSGKGVALASVDFRITIPHSLRLHVRPPAAASAAALNAVTVASTYRRVALTENRTQTAYTVAAP